MNDKPEIFIILTPGFPAHEKDTTCLPMQLSLVRSIQKNYPGIAVTVLSFQYPFTARNYYCHEIPVISFGGKNKGGLHRRILWKQVAKALQRLNTTYEIKGLLSLWAGECALVGKKFARKNSLLHFSWVLGQDARKGNKYLTKMKAVPRDLIALSDFIAAELERNYGLKNVPVIPPGIDSVQFKPHNNERDIDLLVAGSLIPLKQVNLFIEAVAVIREKYPAIHCVVCGEGSEREKLEAMVSRYELKDHISFTGECSHPDLLKLMQRTKILLHPSSYEGFGMVCIEALQAGAYVISYVKPMNEQLSNWYIVNNNAEMISKTIELLPIPAPVVIQSYLIEKSAEKIMRLFSL